MAFRAGLHWSTHPDRIAEAALAHGERIVISVGEFAAALATVAEREARQNAPWRDRSGLARRSLHAFAERDGRGFNRVTLAHGVSYGIWLEVKHAGRWGIVVKTLARLAPEWAAFLRSIGF